MTLPTTTRTGAVILLGALVASACSGGVAARRSAKPVRRIVPPTSVMVATTTSVPASRLVAWKGPVEHLFFHTLVIHPELAFTSAPIGQGFRDWFVTVGEFRAILHQLYANGWTLVDINRAARGLARVPPGRRPLVLSEDDVNYYDDTRALGLGWKLALDTHGDVKVEEHELFGIHLTDHDLVPMVDEFVSGHPLFSADGAKGVLAVTGYEGVLGERVNDRTAPDWSATVARAKALVARLRATGWTFASHSYAHVDETKVSVARLMHDSTEWKTEDEPIVGPTDVYVYPYGAGFPIDSPKIDVLRGFGFTVVCDIDVVPRLAVGNGVTVMTRRHIDGVSFADQPTALAKFFDVSTVEDYAARGITH
ncbi:MAG: hypothetical protein QOF59_3 [Actinomycetota bacterium]|nr:hypothetical protein [Actinomycetota bacterium]